MRIVKFVFEMCIGRSPSEGQRRLSTEVPQVEPALLRRFEFTLLIRAQLCDRLLAQLVNPIG
jgi:hypothetical protein